MTASDIVKVIIDNEIDPSDVLAELFQEMEPEDVEAIYEFVIASVEGD